MVLYSHINKDSLKSKYNEDQWLFGRKFQNRNKMKFECFQKSELKNPCCARAESVMKKLFESFDFSKCIEK